MIRDINHLRPDEVLRAEFAIVGAGFAGVDLALYLSRQGANVILLESGREEFDPKIQSLTRFENRGKAFRKPDPSLLPHLPVHLRGEILVRQFGGTSVAWSGKWRTFDEFDFNPKPWVPYSGWPVSLDELKPYYREIAADYGLADFEAFARSESVMKAKTELKASGLRFSFHYWQKTVMMPASHFRRELEERCDVVLGANVVDIRLSEDRQRVTEFIIQSLEGRRCRVSAEHFILAAGGLECAHLLLAANSQMREGIGNARGLVGRFFMDHPKFKRGRLFPGPAMKKLEAWTRKDPRPRFFLSLSLTEEVQRREGLLDHAFHFSPVYTYQIDYPKEAVERLKAGLRRKNVQEVASAFGRLVASPASILKVLAKSWHKDRGGPIAWYAVQFYVEQAPNPDSRLTLSAATDALGMPKLAVDWQLNQQDHESFPKMIYLFVQACTSAGLGRLDFGPERMTLDESTDGAHHIGSTRMGATPDEGVVDRDCRVFGVSNLFIASSSVFPTGHSAAPTMTILAMTRRLGHHLAALRSTGRGQQPVMMPAEAVRATD